MAFYKKKKKPPVLSREEREDIQRRLEAQKKWFKPLRGKIVYKREGSTQEVIDTARYHTEEDLRKEAQTIIDLMNRLDASKKWVLVGCETIGSVAEIAESTEDEE